MSNLRSCDLRGHLEAAMASEAIGGNMHMDTRVIMVTDVKYEVIWPLRLFGGHQGLGGHWRQYAHGYQGNQGCRFQIWGHMTSEVIWRLAWPRRPLETICTWITGYSRLPISNLRSFDLRGCLKATMASEAVRGNMHMDTRVVKVADFKSEVKWPSRSFGVIYLLG